MYCIEQMNLCLLQNEINLGILLVILFFSAVTNGALLPSTPLSLKEIHLVRCLTDISQRFFAPGLTVVISSPSTYRDVQQELIAEIWRTSLWPVIVAVDGNISKPNAIDFIVRDSSYIILSPDIFSLGPQLNALLEYKFPRYWNPEARFVFAVAREFPIHIYIQILNFFSVFKLYNCIFVSQQYMIYKEYGGQIEVNVVEIGMRLWVYTWFPYQSSDSCTEVNDITLLDSWVISGQGHFTMNTDLFPRKISNNLNGCPMKGTVINEEMYFTTNYTQFNDTNGNDVWLRESFDIKLLKVVLRQMNMTLVPVPKTNSSEVITDIPFHVFYGNKNYIILGDLLNLVSMLPFFECTNFYHFTNIRWYVPCSIKYPRWSSIFRILSAELWLVLIMSIVTATILITLFGRYSCTSEWQVYKTLTSSLTNVWAVILGVSVSTMPRAPSLRSLFLAWVCFSVAFSTVFQAFLTTFLVDSGYKTPIQNMDELFASDIKLGVSLYYNSILHMGDETEVLKVIRNLADCPSFKVCLKWAMFEKNMSIIFSDNFAEESYALGTFVGENSEPLLCKLEDGVFLRTGRTMITLRTDPLMRRVTEIIDRVVEAGIYNFWISLKLNWCKILSHKIALVHPLDEYYSFNLYHMQPAFYLLLMGWCLSALCFMVELLYSRVISRRK